MQLRQLNWKQLVIIALILALAGATRAIEPAAEIPLAVDFDGDGLCDPTTYLRSSGLWLTRLSGGQYRLASWTFGGAAFTALAGDFDGDGLADPALYQDETGSWLVRLSGSGYAPAVAALGGQNWTPVPADYDGDGKTDLAVYENSSGVWLALLSGSAYNLSTFPYQLGGPGYRPSPADYDGDGLADPAVYAHGIWGALLSSQAYALAALRTSHGSGLTLAADCDGDLKADPALYQVDKGLWTVYCSAWNYAPATLKLGGGMPALLGDFDGDGLADPSVYQESTGSLICRLSSLGLRTRSLAIAKPAAVRVLVLYDSGGAGGGEIGWIHSKLLGNLLNHFDLIWHAQPVEDYVAGTMAAYTHTFYLGSYYDNPLPSGFLADALTGQQRLFWIGYNLWQLAWTLEDDHDPRFIDRFGFAFMQNLNGFSEVRYKGQRLSLYDTEDDLGSVEIVDPNSAKALASAWRSDSLNIPYILRSSNLWYVANNPISSDYMADGALAFADLLHDFLGIQHPANHRAIIRIEDVNAETPGPVLQAIAECLHARRIPFVISLIPLYLDPLGVVHQGFPTSLELSANPGLVRVLKNIGKYGGQILQHGTTHQYAALPNPDGSTGADYEFYRVISSNGTHITLGPLPEDSPLWAGQRVAAGKTILAQYGLKPVAWLTPHYYASATAYGVFPLIYKIALDRGVYFSSNENGLYDASQLTPFLIKHDYYGQTRIPETISYISPDEGFLPSNLVERAKANLVLRDGWAGCYYHWFFGTNYLGALVDGITNLGYRFVPVTPNMQ